MLVSVRRSQQFVLVRCLSNSTRRLLQEPGFKYTECLRRGDTTPPRIAGRKWLVGSTYAGNKLPKYLAPPRKNKPAVFEADDKNIKDINVWAEKAHSVIEKKLHNLGTILFKGLPLHNVRDFSAFVKGLGYQFGSYTAGGGERREMAKHVLTATDSDPPECTIEPHNEMAYTNHYPLKIIFFCDVPPEQGNGGESVICDVRETLSKLDPEIVDKFDRLGIQYRLYISSSGKYKSIQNVFGTTDKVIIQKFMEDRGYGHTWENDGSLYYWSTLPAFRTHPKTKERVWFNSASLGHASFFRDHPCYAGMDIPDDKLPYTCYYGDGSEIETETLRHIRDVMWQSTVGFQMEKGEVLVYDNIYSQHGRIGYTGERKMYVTLITN